MSQVYDEPIVVRLTQPVGPYPVGTEFGFRDVADAIKALGSSAYFTVVRTQDGDPIPPPTPEDLTEAERQALARARAARLIRGGEFDPLVPGPGEVIVGSADGPVGKPVAEIGGGASLTAGARTVVLGDSITRGGNTTYNTHTIAGPWGYATYASLLSGGKMHVVHNAGVDGNTTEQIRDRVATDVIPYAPDRCIVMGGANDTDEDWYVPEDTLKNLTDAWDALRAAGIEPVACTPPPRTGYAERTADLSARILMAAERRGIMAVDMFTPLADPVTGGWLAGTSDGNLHPNNRGAFLMGQAFWTQAKGLYERVPAPYLAGFAGSGHNLIKNGVFTGGTDGVATDWQLNAQASLLRRTEADPAITGNWQVQERTGTGTEVSLQQTVARSWGNGDTLQLTCRFVTEQMSGGCAGRIYVAFPGSINYEPLPAVTENVNGILRYTFIPPNDVSQLVIRVRVAPEGTGIVKVAQMAMLNLTALGLA